MDPEHVINFRNPLLRDAEPDQVLGGPSHMVFVVVAVLATAAAVGVAFLLSV